MIAFQRAAALRAGVDLQVFDNLGGGPATAKQLAIHAGVPERGMRILCDYLTAAGLIEKSGAEYRHTPTSAVFLDRRSPASMAGMVPFIQSKKIMAGALGLTESVRRGGTTLDEPLGGDEVAEWVTFARTMQPLVASAAAFMADVLMRGAAPTKVLDVAASHGLFGFAVKERAPACELVALDYASVLEVTAEHAAARGMTLTLLPGSALDVELGTGYDAVLVTNLFHHFSVAENVAMLRRFHAAMAPGGRMLVLEFIPNEDRVTPPIPAMFAVGMLSNTPDGDAYTMADYAKMLEAADFAKWEMLDVPQSPQRLIVIER